VGSWAVRFVGLSGVGLVVAAVVGQFMHEASSTNTVLVVAGAAMVVIAPLLPKLESFEFGPTRAAAKFRAAEDDIEKGNLVEVDEAVKAVEAAFLQAGSSSRDCTYRQRFSASCRTSRRAEISRLASTVEL
jgi:hypothetical protein